MQQLFFMRHVHITAVVKRKFQSRIPASMFTAFMGGCGFMSSCLVARVHWVSVSLFTVNIDRFMLLLREPSRINLLLLRKPSQFCLLLLREQSWTALLLLRKLNKIPLLLLRKQSNCFTPASETESIGVAAISRTESDCLAAASTAELNYFAAASENESRISYSHQYNNLYLNRLSID